MKRVTHYDQVGFIPEMPGFFNIWKSVWYISLHQIEQKQSLDAEKAFDKNQYPFMIKILLKADTERIYLNIIKTIYDKPTTNIILNGEKRKTFPVRLATGQGNTLSPLLFNIVLGSSGNQISTKAIR